MFRKFNNNKTKKVVITNDLKSAINEIKGSPKAKLDFLVKRGYIDKYKPYYGFANTVFLIDGELLMIEDRKFEILTQFINFDVLIEEEGDDFYDA